ncbi:MAG: membrane protein insertase YidC [Bacteroidales bacterium]|nr:membrane protein insertase YidC [Bacteroidales bacterium]
MNNTFDKNTLIGILLLLALFVGFSIFNRPSQEEVERQKRYRDSIAQVQQEQFQQQLLKQAEDSIRLAQAQSLDTIAEISDSARADLLASTFGDFAPASAGMESEIILANNLLHITLNSKGAQISSVRVKGYKTYDGDSLEVVKADPGNEMNLDFFNGNKPISTKNLFFTVASQTDNSVVLRANAGDDKWLEFAYYLPEDSYVVDFTISFHNLKGLIKQNSSFLDFTWNQFLPVLERGNDWEVQNSGLYYKYTGDDDDVESIVLTDGEKNEQLNTSTKWIAYKGQFFSSVIMNKTSFPNALLSSQKTSLNGNMLFMSSKIGVPNNCETDSMAFYFGPNKYSILSNTTVGVTDSDDLDLDQLVPLGWGIFGWVNRWAIIPLFNWLGSFISNYGLIILLMTIVIKLVIFPLTYKSYQSSAKMRALKPMVEEIGKKYPKPEQAMQKQQATMDLYKRAGASPLGGCLPMLLQMPILIAMFRFFPASIELRQQSFLWASDLSSYDSILDLPFSIPWYGDHISLFTLLMAAGIIIQQKMNSGQMDTGQTMPGMKLMLYLMPAMMILWFNDYSAGLSYYYFLSNVISIIQIYFIRRHIDEKALFEKLKAKADKNAKEPKKKSGFLARLEEAQRRQMEQLKKQQRRK